MWSLPVVVDAPLVRLVADLVVQVVELGELLDDPPHHPLVHLQQAGMLVERVHVPAVLRPDALDVVPRIHRAQVPLLVFVHRAEQIHLDDDAALGRIRQKIAQPAEIRFVPAAQVELRPAAGVPRLVAARPRADETALERSQRIARNVEGPLRLDIRPAERARVVEAVGGQRIEVLFVVEVEIEHRAVVFARRDQHRRLAAEEKVVPVLWMQGKRRVFRGKGAGCK